MLTHPDFPMEVAFVLGEVMFGFNHHLDTGDGEKDPTRYSIYEYAGTAGYMYVCYFILQYGCDF